jgi:hypothetical protein
VDFIAPCRNQKRQVCRRRFKSEFTFEPSLTGQWNDVAGDNSLPYIIEFDALEKLRKGPANGLDWVDASE